METKNSVNLSVNPCKMCMPLGGVMAMKGIENSMVILHGSQGCSTYIRRHMATHFNEPIDIASSSLTENGTIYGGANNLKQGLKNIIEQYKPETIGVLTTCLSETIGEDIDRIVTEFKTENEDNKEISDINIVTVPTPAYSGTQSEGYYRVLRRLVETFSRDDYGNAKINIISGSLTPGDIRQIKYILKCFDIEYNLLPDISITLDAVYSKKYNKIPEGGTTLKEIEEMGGAIATIEMGLTVEDDASPGVYLESKFGVPLFKCAVPIGIINTDKFINLISEITGKDVPKELEMERGRYLDGVIDSHKYNGEGRAIIFGEPELVYALTCLCVENGVQPVVVATGSKNKLFKGLVKNITKELDEQPIILDDTDFAVVEKFARELDVNLLIGDSNGRRIEEKLGIKLVRIGFPIHDRVGAQRQVNTGYFGSLRLLDEMTNSILERKDKGYRKDMFEKYYVDLESAKEKVVEKPIEIPEEKTVISIEEKTKTHPCFNKCAHENARMHIPVAPKCNISCNYCNRKYDCVNESRPGVTSSILTPEQALASFKEYQAKLKNITVVGIAGPGDALANFDAVKKSIELIKEYSPKTTFCLSTNGLMLPFYVREIVELGISHVTITLNTVDPEIGAKLYREVHYLGKKYEGVEGATILLQNQLSGLKYLTDHGIVCKVNIVYVKGVNDKGIPDTVKKVKELGAFMTNIMPLIPVAGSAFEGLEATNGKELNEMRKKCEVDLKQMYHCRQCRADAVGTLDKDISLENKIVVKEEKPEVKPVRFAVASKSGINIDTHFGHASEFYIYDLINGEVYFTEKRSVEKYCNGKEDCDTTEDKFAKIFKTIEDCNDVLVLRVGPEPMRKLEEKNIKVHQLFSEIKEGIRSVIGEVVS
ncbi:MAG: nitrogenase cofactor biosynthesis protein NifB [Clostridiaceae bacterium]